MDPFERLMARFDPLGAPPTSEGKPVKKRTAKLLKSHGVKISAQPTATSDLPARIQRTPSPSPTPGAARGAASTPHMPRVRQQKQQGLLSVSPLTPGQEEAAKAIQKRFRDRREVQQKQSEVAAPVSHRQQFKHALAINAAHVITEDFITLTGAALSGGVLLTDRTDRRLKLIHSLSELQRGHVYITEYGNHLKWTDASTVALADSIKISVNGAEEEKEEENEQGGYRPSHATPPMLGERMQAYNQFQMNQISLRTEAQNEEATDDAQSQPQPPESPQGGGGRLQRMDERLGCIEQWLQGVRHDAIHDHQIREQAAVRTSMIEERLIKLEELVASLKIDVTDLALAAQAEELEPEDEAGTKTPPTSSGKSTSKFFSNFIQ